jgi:CheY-like chemotaxis protein
MTKHVLVVDDDLEALGAVAKMLAEAGYRVYRAQSATDAIALIQMSVVDLVITEIVMPEVSGWEVFLTARERSKSLPVIFLTDFIPKILRERVRLDTHSEVVEKPFTVAQLGSAIDSVMFNGDCVKDA